MPYFGTVLTTLPEALVWLVRMSYKVRHQRVGVAKHVQLNTADGVDMTSEMGGNRGVSRRATATCGYRARLKTPARHT
jgi:hypothetical protein